MFNLAIEGLPVGFDQLTTGVAPHRGVLEQGTDNTSGQRGAHQEPNRDQYEEENYKDDRADHGLSVAQLEPRRSNAA